MKPHRAPVLDEGALRAALARARAQGARIVFTNGGFDLLHVGHVRMLEEAATLGDVLVVAVNDDASVRASKGPSRPLVPAHERAELVARVAGVDFVHVFSDATVDRLLALLAPDVHAKGRDYAEENHPEAATNRALGVRMAFVGDAKAHAASDLAARLRAPAVAIDRVEAFEEGAGRGLALAGKRRLLAAAGLGDLAALLGARAGTVVQERPGRGVRRIEVAGEIVYAKVEHPARRGPGGLEEFRHHLALRAVGLRAAEPWLALEGAGPDGRPARALVTREARGLPLDRFLAARFEGARARERGAWARGLGATLRALFAARFTFPDLLAYHLLVEGTPAGGAASIQFIDLARLARARRDVGPAAAAPGLAALALSLRPVSTPRFRLAILRALLGGSLREARPWLAAIQARMRRVEGRGTFRRLGTRTP